MFRVLLLTLIMLQVILSFGQQTAMHFMGLIPQLDFEPCSASPEAKAEFLARLKSVDSSLRLQLEEQSANAEEFQNEHEEEARINVLMKMGYSREQAEKLKNADQMSEDELMAIANEMLVNRDNVTLGEYNQLSESDTAAQGRWAQAQSTIYMADVQVDPEKYQKEQLKIKSDLELQTELQFQREKLRAGEDKYRQQIDSLDKEAEYDRNLMNDKIEKLQKALDDCQNDEECDRIRDQMYQLRLGFCQKFTPRYLGIVDQFKSYIIENIDEYSKWEELQMRSVEAQTGIKDPDYVPGLYTSGIVGCYCSLLADAFKYVPSVMLVIN